jgi:hypothetical protein
MMKKIRRSRAAMVGICCALVGAAAVPVYSLATVSGPVGDGPMVFQSGASSVTYQGATNVGSLPATSFKQTWTRVGDVVHMTGVIPVQAAAANTDTQIYIPLPPEVDTAFATHFDCEGTGDTTPPNDSAMADVQAAVTTGHTHQCLAYYRASTTALVYVFYNLSYRIQS